MSHRKRCCVPFCIHDGRLDGRISIHSFPTDFQRQKEWYNAVKKAVGRDFKVTKDPRICSGHFRPHELLRTLSGMRKIAPTAVPSIFLCSPPRNNRHLQCCPINFKPNCTKVLFVGPTNSKPTAENRRLAENCAPNMEYKSHILSMNGDHDYLEKGIMTVIEKREAVTCYLEPSKNDHDYLERSNLTLEERLDEAVKHIEVLERKLEIVSVTRFGLARYSQDSQMINFYTGFPNYDTLIEVFEMIVPGASDETCLSPGHLQKKPITGVTATVPFSQEPDLPPVDQFFLFLVKVRLGLFDADVADRFGLSISDVRHIVITWANYLYRLLSKDLIWPNRCKISESLPECFKQHYSKARVIVDCMEFRIQTPSSALLKSEVYSDSKNTTALKGLVGITPSGSVSFVSALQCGSISDSEIMQASGLLGLLESGDVVMANKNVVSNTILNSIGCSLVTPPMLTKNMLLERTARKAKTNSDVRIHMERAINRVKDYHIFNEVLPLSLAESVNHIWTVCCIITNLKGPLKE